MTTPLELSDELDYWLGVIGDRIGRSRRFSETAKDAIAALRQAAAPQGREALEPFLSKVRWPLNDLPDTDVVQCKVVTPDYETGGILRASFGLMVGDFKRLASLTPAVAPDGAGDYTAWLVELNDQEGPLYFRLTHDDEDWTKNHDDALHLSRREDAQQIIGYYGWTRAKAVEHCWPAPAQRARERKT